MNRLQGFANLAALAVILLAGALSTFWVFLVPIFQSADEPGHFDYAVSIYSAHRLVTRADGARDWIVSPYTKYLIAAAEFERIAGHSPMRVPQGYGTREYYARLDAAAPSLRDPPRSDGTINYIVGLYPFGFYALEALWMHAVAALTPSLAALFFSARIFCVLLTMLGLYFNYRSARNLGVGPWTSVALIAAIGLFPLTSWISSYVQPDDLSYALVSAVIFFATQLRTGAPAPGRIVPLGIALGLLAVTKYQFFLSAAAPAALLVAVALLRARSTARQVAACIAGLLAPAIALLCVQHFIVDAGTAVAHTAPSDVNFQYLRSVAAGGPGALLHYAFASFTGAFVGCFISGICAAGFWQVVGWGDVPIVIGNASLEIWLRAGIALLTLAVAVVVTFRTCRNALRLVTAAARGHARHAVAVAAADPAFNAYLCCLAIILGLYVLTNNVFGLSGRHWYPYIFPAFLCLVWYAPKALLRRHAKLSAALAGGLLVYSLVAAPYAALAAVQRYYGPPGQDYATLTPPPGEIEASRAIGALWPLKNAAYYGSPAGNPFVFDRGATIAVSGAAMEGTDDGASRVAVLLDHRRALAVLTRQYLFGIAEISHNIAAGYSGFGGVFSTAGLAEGPHTITAYAQTSGKRFETVEPSRLFFVTNANGRFSQAFVREISAVQKDQDALRVDGVCRGRLTQTDGAPAADDGSLLVVHGALSPSRASHLKAVWLLLDDRPFPAKLDPADGSFFALVPTLGVAAGTHRLTAYASDTGVGSLAFTLLPGSGQREFPSDPPAVCADPLRELAAE